MRLSAAARRFDSLICADAFVPSVTFPAQIVPFDNSARDGVTVNRRVLAFDPRVTLPARRVLLIDGEYWITGAAQTDYFLGNSLRKKHVLHKAQSAVTLKTPAQLLSTGGTATYGSRLWVKDTKETVGTSTVEGFFNTYLPSSESLVAGDLVVFGSQQYLARNVFQSSAGFLIAECFELPAGSLTTGTYKTRTYTPATDALALSAGTSVNCLLTRFQDSFFYPNAAADKFVDGDVRIFVTKAAVAAPKANDVLVMADVTWQVLAAQSDRLCWNLHCRHAGVR